jgi:hypothetical protein
VSYDDEVGSHSIHYASSWSDRSSEEYESGLEISNGHGDSLNAIRFERQETRLILAAREYFILRRSIAHGDGSDSSTSAFDMERLLSVGIAGEQRREPLQGPCIGMRVQTSTSGTPSTDQMKSRTILAIDQQQERLVLVSDSGEVSIESSSQVNLPATSLSERAHSLLDRGRQDRALMNRPFPFLSARHHLSELSRRDNERSQASSSNVGVMKRTWSALSLMEAMRPIELHARDDSFSIKDKIIPGRGLVLSCSQGKLVIDHTCIEVPPLLRVEFSAQETLPTVDMQSKRGLPLIGALSQLTRRGKPFAQHCAPKASYKLYYAIRAGELLDDDRNVYASAFPEHWGQRDPPRVNEMTSTPSPERRAPDPPAAGQESSPSWMAQNGRSRKLSLSPFLNEDDRSYEGLCDGLGEICVQCMEVLGLLSEFSERPNISGGKSRVRSFENSGLSKKLVEELDDPLTVVGGALPEWCTLAPMFAPRLFSYESRRLLLDRSAFGVSRSTLKQQEAKVNVGRLRQRMAALRNRAVELVGEAFSGGAEDPTALQLQADELYGMEESLANRVKAAFRAEQWEEHALEVAKTSVRRDRLLQDAERIMQKIASTEKICNRRLEVRFENESGFDAASGNEAGVTRGFYADVAEALLSCESVAGVYKCLSSQVCPDEKSTILPTSEGEIFGGTSVLYNPCKLPLFVPDMDSKSQVIIPTPRSDPRSGLGVFPRAILSHHPQYEEVLARYRFMGRLFASAMRDGFMFPLPLSSSFLKLVQHCAVSEEEVMRKSKSQLFPSSRKSLFTSNERSRHPSYEDMADDVLTGVKGAAISHASIILTSSDLPRPGFLGGEVYAVDIHICSALDKVDAIDPPLSRNEVDKRYREIASDKTFARVALGKSYDCSFEHYFQDRTFVDPLDPTQGEDATPLCADGHKKQVTIYNIREWVALSRRFLLHDGVLAQAQAFRSGVNDFFCCDYLRLFTPEELQRDVCGVGDNVDSWVESDIRKLMKLDGAAEALVAVAAIGGEGGAALSRRFSSASPTIGFLVKALLEASPKKRRQFLSFVTSVPIVTPGKIEGESYDVF